MQYIVTAFYTVAGKETGKPVPMAKENLTLPLEPYPGLKVDLKMGEGRIICDVKDVVCHPCEDAEDNDADTWVYFEPIDLSDLKLLACLRHQVELM